MSKGKDLIRPVLTLGIICLVVTGLLAATNHFTAPIIAENARKKADESRRVVLADGEDFQPVALDAALLAEKKVEEVTRAGNGAGYTVTTALNGYGGPVKIMFGIDAEGKIAGVAILEHNETKGLGERITGDDFRGQFIGKSGNLTVTRGTPGGQEIAALAGATISSNAVTNSANVALEIAALAKEAG